MARWMDLATWVGPTPNKTTGGMTEYRGLVLHTASGYYLGTIAWQKNPDANVSSHFIVAGPRDVQYGVPDGKLAQMVDTADTAWTQRSGNGHWLSIECSGFGGTNSGTSGDKLSAAQIEACAQILARMHREYGVPLQIAVNPDGRGLGHHSMGCNWPAGAWGHCFCPGDPIIAQKPAIVARAIEIVNGDDMALSDVDAQALIWRVDALTKGLDTVAGGPTKGERVAAWSKVAGATATVLAARLDAILAAAADDGDVTVQMSPDALAEVQAIRDQLAAVPQATADLVHADLAD